MKRSLAKAHLGSYPQLSWEGVEDIPVPVWSVEQLAPAPSGESLPADGDLALADGVAAFAGPADEARPAPLASRPACESPAPLTTEAEIVSGLNPSQKEAVTYQDQTLLVLAGAGSGKTRVLTRRIAWLLATHKCEPWQVLAITFTNKAAAEMRERVQQLVGEKAQGMWVATFHSACSRILRQYGQVLGLSKNFTIYDTTASKRLVGLILDELGIDAKKFQPKTYAHHISNCKNLGLTWQNAQEQDARRFPKDFATVFRLYQERLIAFNAVDFDDLLIHVLMLLKTSPDVSYALRRKFRYVLVDEYQDTNHVQYQLVRMLCGRGTDVAQTATLPPLAPAHLTVVGDPDQSIYAFRGADVRNIEQFEEDFPGAHKVFLEQNYRSTNRILTAANSLIESNHSNHAKQLWSELGTGEKVGLRLCNSGLEEALSLANTVSALRDQGYKYSDVAVLYRTNSLSREIEEQLLRANIPTRVLGGTRFYDRAEIKDALALLTLVVNQDDEVALLRVINTPKRGIGDGALKKLRAEAQNKGVSLAQIIGSAWWHTQGLKRVELCKPELVGVDEAPSAAPETLPAKVLKALGEFWQAIVQARHSLWQGEGIAVVLQDLLNDTGYIKALSTSLDPQDASRVENLSELHNVARLFDTEQQHGTLADFLERISLVADSDQLEDNELGAVTLMTVHTAKGLEYPVVWLAGWEQGMFPHQLAFDEPGGLSEERRLAYVAITRAQQRLYISAARSRMQWGQITRTSPSQFLEEIADEVFDVSPKQARSEEPAYGGAPFGRSRFSKPDSDDVLASQDSFEETNYAGSRAQVSGRGARRVGGVRRLGQAVSAPNPSGTDREQLMQVRAGQRVKHPQHGKGTVVSTEGEAANRKATVQFDSGEQKRLLLRLAPLEIIG